MNEGVIRFFGELSPNKILFKLSVINVGNVVSKTFNGLETFQQSLKYKENLWMALRIFSKLMKLCVAVVQPIK